MTEFIDAYDHHPSGFWDSELDCPCDRLGVPCRDCEAEQLAAMVDDEDDFREDHL